jgi:hypothetical protein
VQVDQADEQRTSEETADERRLGPRLKLNSEARKPETMDKDRSTEKRALGELGGALDFATLEPPALAPPIRRFLL